MDMVCVLLSRVVFILDQAGWVGQGLQWGLGVP